MLGVQKVEGVGFDPDSGAIVDFGSPDKFINLFFGIMWDGRTGKLDE